MITVRRAIRSDYPIIKAYDPFMGDRREDIERGELFVADHDDHRAAGYLKLSSAMFFNKPFVTYLCVKSEFRREGVASKLLLGIEQHVGWHRLFISTEEDNIAMQELLAKLGYEKCGEITRLNENGVPEWFYSKDIG